jgi:hypothetical protein
MNGYELSRYWFDWCFENPEKISPNHTALYFFCIEHCNRMGWKEKFGLPTSMAKEAIGIRSYNTYINTLNDLVNFGFITLIEKSKNQYSSNIIALSKNNKALNNAFDKASINHTTKQLKSTGESIDSIDKQITLEQLKPETQNKFNPTDFLLFHGANIDMIKEWFAIRKKKKGVNSEIAMQAFIREVKESKQDINAVLKKCIEKSWVGFEAEWIKGQKIDNDNLGKVAWVKVKLSDTIFDFIKSNYEDALKNNKLNCDNPIILKEYYK